MVQHTVVVICACLCVATFFLIRREIQKAHQETLDKLMDMLRKGHGYSDPSAAAVATGEREASPAPTSGAMPVPARAAGLAVDHCHNDACEPGDDDRAAPPGIDAGQWHAMGAVGLCRCYCDGCARATTFAEQAEREVMGPSLADDPRQRRP